MAPIGIAAIQRRLPRYLAVLAVIACLAYYFGFPARPAHLNRHHGPHGQHGHSSNKVTDLRHHGESTAPAAPDPLLDKAMVVARLLKEDTSWYHHFFPDWQKFIYVMDDPTANLTVAKNKGRESTAYLSFIIDHYHKLPNYMLFLHAARYQWHNEDPMYDGVPPIQNLQLPYVDEEGYVNMRCTWLLGCPSEIHPAGYSSKTDGVAETNEAYPEVMKVLLPGTPVPEAVGVHCGAQFAVSKKMILQRPLSDYQKIRDWLWETSLPDNVSGRVLEYMWHSEQLLLQCLEPRLTRGSDIWQTSSALSRRQHVLL